MELRTKRCLIRNVVPEDAAAFFHILSDARVMEHLEPPIDRAKTERFLQEAGLCAPPLIYAVVWTRTGQVIGHVIFHRYEEADYEIGWVLDCTYWGLGIADELTGALLRQAALLGAAGCVIECAAQQHKSRKIALRNGFVPDGSADGLERYRLLLP